MNVFASQWNIGSLERGGEHFIWASCAITNISQLIYKVQWTGHDMEVES